MKRLMGVAVLVVSLSSPAFAGMGGHVTSHYRPSEVGIVVRSGMPTVILGRAGTARPDEVLSLLRLPGWLREGSFVAAPPDTTGARLVILLNPADPVAAKRHVCGDVAALKYGEQGRRFVLRAAYCSGDRIVSRVTASERPVSGADDRRLASIIGHVIRMLFPAQTRFQVDPPNV